MLLMVCRAQFSVVFVGQSIIQSKVTVSDNVTVIYVTIIPFEVDLQSKWFLFPHLVELVATISHDSGNQTKPDRKK